MKNILKTGIFIFLSGLLLYGIIRINDNSTISFGKIHEIKIGEMTSWGIPLTPCA